MVDRRSLGFQRLQGIAPAGGLTFLSRQESKQRSRPRTFRMVLGLPRRPKGEANRVSGHPRFPCFPLWKPLAVDCRVPLFGYVDVTQGTVLRVDVTQGTVLRAKMAELIFVKSQ